MAEKISKLQNTAEVGIHKFKEGSFHCRWQVEKLCPQQDLDALDITTYKDPKVEALLQCGEVGKR